jgi:hypothetical protein
MLVSDAKRFVGFHTPKTGGSSQTAALWPYLNGCGRHVPREEFGWQVKAHIGPMHATVADSWARFGQKRWLDYTWFSFVRNPFDIVVSAWMRKRKEVYAEPDERMLMRYRNAGIELPIPDLSLSKFLDIELGNNQFLHCRRTQCEYLFKDAPRGLDFIGRFENLSEDWEELCKLLKIKAPLPHRNKSNRDNGYRQYYDEQSRQRVQEFFQEDLETFGYEY